MSSIATLTRYRWTLPVLAALARTGGSRFVPLAQGLGVSRDALRQTLDVVIEAGLVMPNPGYGHPSRPEYVLTDRGRTIATAAKRLVDYLARNGLAEVGLKRWSLRTINALSLERRFGDLRRTVDATPRALTLALKDLAEAGLVERRVHASFPPATTYRLSKRGSTVQSHVAALAAAAGETAVLRPVRSVRR